MPFNTGAQPSILLRFHFRLPRGNRMMIGIGEGGVDGTRCVVLSLLIEEKGMDLINNTVIEIV